ncbi:hypothetical protein SETIT_2G011800v2 [Setaria italica]|uniref:Uncharacterized protein n=1 Tax=Setaria italica TaxID=4555 RepID=K4A1F4_SETIT|nr:hypothetical protein SETIT_2G011800v2 [Setaria italica]
MVLTFHFINPSTRYLIVLDDIDQEQWDSINSTLPEKTGSRIIVTTRTQALAAVCCNHGNNGYAYNMRSLDDKHSKELLQSFTETDYKIFWSDLGSHMAKEYAFRKLQQILLSNYRSLRGRPVDLKTCLLYVCVFPNGHPIKRSSLMRRWDKSLEELIDRNIIWQIDPSKNAKAKTRRAQGIMHEVMLHMSISNYRHLFLDGRPATSSARVSHQPCTCGDPGDEKLREAVVEFANLSCFEDHHMDGIHKLWHLRYLSLGATVSHLPSKIEKLHCLETLDMRKAMIEILPVEVLKLPHLAHMLGKFKLGKRDWKMGELDKFLPKESNLQTLAGFVTDSNRGFPLLLVRMKKLRKVKIWCNEDDCVGLAELSTGIKKFVEDELDTSIGACCLSLNFMNSSGNILHSLQNSFGYLSSLKLHGALSGLTQFATSLCGLTELCLSSTNNLMSNEILNLRKLIHLEYLKLVKISLGGFTIRRQDLPRLLRLCLVQSPTLPTIEEGALRNIISLQLLSEDLGDVSGIEIRRSVHLQEVALDSEISQLEAKTVWEDAAKKHPKRPRVLYLKRVDPQGTGSMVKYVTARGSAHETDCAITQEMKSQETYEVFSEGRGRDRGNSSL